MKSFFRQIKKWLSSQKISWGLILFPLFLLVAIISISQISQKQRATKKTRAKQEQIVTREIAELTGIPDKDREKLHLKNRFSYSAKKYTPLDRTSEVRSSFEKEYGQGSQIKWDEKDKVARQVILSNNSPTILVDEKNIEEVTKSFILKNQKIFSNLNSNSLKLEKTHRSKQILTAVFSQRYQNIPVYGGFFNLTASNNKIILIDNYYFYNINTPTKPTKTEEEVIKIAKDFLDIKSEEPSKTTLMIYPELTEDSTTYHLSYKVDLPLIKEPLSQYSVFVDTQTGEVLDYFDNIIYENLSGNVTGKIFPKHPFEPQIDVPFKNNEIRLILTPSPVVTNSAQDGSYSFPNLSPGTYNLEANLSGPWVDVLNEDRERAAHQLQVTVPGTHNWNWANNDSSDRQEESNVFYHVNIAHDFFTKGDPFNIAGVNYKLPALVEYGDDLCNAYFLWGASQIAFGKGCGNFALQSGEIYHEYTHFVTSNISSMYFISYWGQIGNLNEGWSDYFACSLTNDPCLHKENPGTDCFKSCQGARKFDYRCNGEPHQCASVISGSLWDLRNDLGSEIVDKLTITAEKLQPLDFADFLTKVVIVDEQLYPNSSHKNQICQAFNNLGIDNEDSLENRCGTSIPYGKITKPEEKEPLSQTTDIKANFCPSGDAQTVNYTLELGEGQDPSSWTQIATGGPITGCQTQVTLTSFNPELYKLGNYTFKLTTVDNLGKTNITLRHFDITDFEFQRVDTGLKYDIRFGYGYFSLALDTNNKPHISYYELKNQDLKYAYHDGNSWQIQGVDTYWLYEGPYNSLALDTSNRPHISYNEWWNQGVLKYAYLDDKNSWQIQRVDTEGDVGEYNSLALDKNNKPHISYRDRTNGDLKYAYLDDKNSWQIQGVDTEGNVGEYNSLALDTSNRPHISYFDGDNWDLKYAYHDGTSWQIQLVDTGGFVGYFSSLALDSSNHPHISYFDNVPRDLKYAYYDGNSWQIQVVDTEGQTGYSTSLALDTSNKPHISYYDWENGDLKYAYLDDKNSWQIQRVDTEGDVGEFTSLSLDTNGRAHISYYDIDEDSLMYARQKSLRPSCFPENSACGGNIPCCAGLECREGKCLPPVFLPDLTVTDFHLTQTPNLQTPLYASVTYKNIGTALSPMFSHRFTLNGDVVYEYFFVSLNPGEERTIGLNDRLPNRNKWKPKAGSNILTTEVDYTNSISESNENNNSLSIKFTAE